VTTVRLERPQLSQEQRQVLEAVSLANRYSLAIGTWELERSEPHVWLARGYYHEGKLAMNYRVELWETEWRVLDLARMDGWILVWQAPQEKAKGKPRRNKYGL